jgi:uncharacterized integral membrane protein (TIGR00698 family)
MSRDESPQQSEILSRGILLCIAIAIISYVLWVSYKPISSLMWAFIVSIIIANATNLPKIMAAGVNFCSRDLLRAVIAVLGIVTSGLIWLQVGVGLLNALAVVFFSYFFGTWLGKKMGLEKTLATLVGVGTAICGASAIAAAAPAVKAREEEVGLALACITLFGLLAMFTYPFLFSNSVVGTWLKHDLNLYGIWCGSGIHEAAQVIAASGALDSAAIGPAMLVKSIRIFMIGPMILVATYLISRMDKSPVGKFQTKAVFPVYGVIFIVNSIFCALLDIYSPQLLTVGFDWITVKKTLSGTIIPFLLATCFAGVGLKVRFRDIAKLGARPFAFGALMALLAGLLALGLAVAAGVFL